MKAAIRLQSVIHPERISNPIPSPLKNSNRLAVTLIVLSVISAAIGFALSILLARVLGPEGFQDYIVAIAALTLLGTICEFGTGKFALKATPQYIQSKQWSLASGFWRFGIGLVLFLSFVALAIVVSWEYLHDQEFGDHLLGITVLFLPSTVLVAVVSEFVMANRAPIRGTLITKLLCPALTMLLLLICYYGMDEVKPAIAIYCFGGAGICGLVIAIGLFVVTSPTESLRHKPEFEAKSWIKQCGWYFVLAFVMSWMFEISVIIMEIAQLSEFEIARFAAAAKTGCFILLVAKSTNKYYSPEISVIMSQQKWERGLALRRNRMFLIGSVCAAFCLAVFLFGKPILRWFGPEYASAYWCLIYISIGASIHTLFSMSPEYLKFSDRQKVVLAVQIGGGIALVTLTWVLGKRFGADGAGAAFGIVFGCVSVVFYWIAQRQIRKVTAQPVPDED